jgi:hypothetical protein
LVEEEVCFFLIVAAAAAANAEESPLESLFLKEETAARARARIGAAGGAAGEVEVEEVEVEEDVEANENVATAVCHLATTAGALFGTEATREVFSRRQTAGRAAA